MAQFEDYKERAKLKDNVYLYRNQEEKGLDTTETLLPYDQEQLTEKMKQRIANSTWEERTAYYFQDTKWMEAKTQRYYDISEGNENDYAEEMAQKYSNHSARKRKKSAREASDSFEDAKDQAAWLNEHQKELSAGELYKRREEIMRLRLMGMKKAAEAKSKSATHEAYLKYKAQLSCLTILQDQQEHLMEQARVQKDKKSYELLKRRSMELAKELSSVRKGLNKVAPSVEETWQREQGVTENEVKSKAKEAASVNPGVTVEDAKALLLLEKLKAQKNQDYPCSMVRLDQNGQPINQAECKKQEWNQSYIKAKEAGDQKALEKMTKELISRVELYSLPSYQELTDQGAMKLFMQHPTQYYEMFMKAPEFFEKELKENAALRDYVKENPYLEAKLKVMEKVSAFLKEEFKRHHINPETATALKPEEEEVKTTITTKKLARYYSKLDKEAQEKKTKDLGVNEHVETLTEEKEALKKMQEINPQFTLVQYRALRELKSGQQEFFDAKYSRHVHSLEKGDYIQSVQSGLRMVRRDKAGRPLSKEDQKNLAHNQAWEKAWAEDDVEAQIRLMREDYEEMTRSFELPEPEKLEEWMDHKLKENPAGLQELYMRLQNLQYFIENNEEAKKYVYKSAPFKNCIELLYPLLDQTFSLGIGAQLGIKHDFVNELIPLTAEEQEKAKKEYQKNLAEAKEAYKQEFDKRYPDMQKMLEDNPGFTVQDYDILKELKHSGNAVQRYKDIWDKLNNERDKKGKKLFDPSRDQSIGLNMVRTNAEGNPATEEDLKIDQKNREWIQAWEEENEEKIFEIMDYEMNHMFDDITMPEPEHLIEWLQNKVETNPSGLFELIRKNLGIDNLKNYNPSMKEHVEKYFQEHPRFMEISELMVQISGFTIPFLSKYYKIENGPGSGAFAKVQEEWKNKEYAWDAEDQVKDMQEHYAKAYRKFKQNKQA